MDMLPSDKNHRPTNLSNIPTYRAGVAQSTAYRLLKKFTEDCVAEYGITTMQWFILGTIYEAGDAGIGVTELSKSVDTNVPYITNTLNLLEQKGIIVRQNRPGDNRAKVVTIDPHYIPYVEKIELELRKKMRQSIYRDITPEELRIYLSVLYKLVDSFE